MPPEPFVVTALPHSADPSASFHVSLYIGHRLERDGVLGDFPAVREWTARLADAEITLLGHRPGVAPEPLGVRRVGVLEPALWPQVFPADLPVAAWEPRDLTAGEWRTFPAHRMDVHAKGLHGAAITASVVVAPQPSELGFLERLLFRFDGYGELIQLYREAVSAEQEREGRGRGRRRRPAGGGLVEALLDPENRYDEMLTRQLDGSEPGVVNGGNAPSTGPWSAGEALVDAHAARRYYQRPEDAFDYTPAPEPGVKPPDGPTPPAPEFHQRIGRLGDVSPLLRSLGLVLDLQVEDVGELAGLAAISAEVRVPGLDNPVPQQPQTRCSVQGRHFTAASSSGRWASGMLRLGDEEQFTLLDLDPDASALKLEQYLRTVPRLLALEANHTEGSSAAPATLRATGFSIAEPARATALHDRVDDAPDRARAVLAGTAPPLDLEQVTRGVRLEVWDDVGRRWLSLHRRLVDVDVEGSAVLAAEPDEGFLQGASLSRSDTATAPPTTYAHEVLAGWDGWSLAAPRPEKVVVHTDGEEVVHEPGTIGTPGAEPVSVTSRVAPGTLPKLRYGRRYSFRAFAVDLAGNSRGLAAPPAAAPAGPPPAVLSAAVDLLSARRTGVDGTAEGAPPSAARPQRAERASSRMSKRDLDRLPAAHRALLTRFGEMTQSALALRTDRRLSIQQAFEDAVLRVPYVHERSDASTPVAVFAEALSSAIADPRGLLEMGLSEVQVAAAATDVVTVPRPFLRWSALIEPAVVPRHPYTWGESLLRLVVRSGVEADGTLTPPKEYAAQHPGLDWREDSQRHLAPPKTSLLEAELHGRLDEAVATAGPGTAAVRRTWLGLALRESGTFLSPKVADPANPGKELPVDGLSFHLQQSAAPLPDEGGNPVVPPTPQTLKRGDPLLPGQYAVHDVDVLTAPYLPDPMAAGLSLVFPDADPVLRAAETAAQRLGVQSLTLRYLGKWPLLDAYRLVLQGGEQLDGVVMGNAVTISVPPGEQLRVRLSSALAPEDLQVFGLWRTLHDTISATPQIAEAAADGWLWWLTPAAEITLVHAVPRPVVAPEIRHLVAVRTEDEATADLLVVVQVHAASTERLDIEARWDEQHDDLAKAGPTTVHVEAVACSTSVGYDESLVLLLGQTGLSGHDGVHHFGDTRHRTVDYTVRGTTRYREFFPLEVAAGKEDLSRVSTVTRVVVNSSARPAKVVVRDVLPLLVWSDATQVAQPFGVRRTRRAGVRIYLDRPWFTTGDGELLGVVVSGPGTRASQERPVSHWAADPIWDGQIGPASAADLPLVTGEQLGDDPAGRPVLAAMTVQASSTDTSPVTVRGYRPEYNADRRLWFVDVALTPGTAFWPFVRLAVGRFQPNSLPGCHLGPVVQCDYAQLVPERSLVVARTDADSVKVAVAGVAGRPRPWGRGGSENATEAERLAPSRTMRVRLERRAPEVGTDLGWVVVRAATLPVLSKVDELITWEGSVTLPDPHGDPGRPGRSGTGDLRIVVEEEERLEADPSPAGDIRTSSRIVYSDEVVL